MGGLSPPAEPALVEAVAVAPLASQKWLNEFPLVKIMSIYLIELTFVAVDLQYVTVVFCLMFHTFCFKILYLIDQNLLNFVCPSILYNVYTSTLQ